MELLVLIIKNIKYIKAFYLTGLNIYSIFFYIGGMQMLLYPAIVLEGSNGDTLGSHMILFIVLEVTVPLFIYLYFNPAIQLFS